MRQWSRWEIAPLLAPVALALLVIALSLLSGCRMAYARGFVCG